MAQRPTRRALIAAGAAAVLAPRLTWADAGHPHFLAAARHADGRYRLHGLDAAGADVFSLPLPARGHAAAAHPHQPLAVAFARRPGTYALVLDCRSGEILHRLAAPAGRHFYGHGCFSQDGSVLFTTENDYDAGEGRLGLWSTGEGYRRMGEIAAGGTGPHDVLRLPGTDILAVANGGIETHPDTGRAKLNLPTMRSRLTYLSVSAGVIEQVVLPDAMRLNSIRHLAVRADGLVAMAMQWQGTLSAVPALAALHRRGEASPRLLTAPPREQRRTAGYAGSVAFTGDGQSVAFTAPRGNRLHLYAVSGRFSASIERPDVCGVAPAGSGLMATDGAGGITALAAKHQLTPLAERQRAWDNHLVVI